MSDLTRLEIEILNGLSGEGFVRSQSIFHEITRKEWLPADYAEDDMPEEDRTRQILNDFARRGLIYADGWEADRNRGYQLTELGRKLLEEGGKGRPNDVADSIDSTDWTGLAAKIDGERLAAIKKQTAALILTIDQSDLDDRTKENAKKHAEAIIALLEAPDPPWENIVHLLNSRYLTAFLNVATIINLIFGR